MVITNLVKLTTCSKEESCQSLMLIYTFDKLKVIISCTTSTDDTINILVQTQLGSDKFIAPVLRTVL